jgi:hypothetical protein
MNYLGIFVRSRGRYFHLASAEGMPPRHRDGAHEFVRNELVRNLLEPTVFQLRPGVDFMKPFGPKFKDKT